MPAPLTNLPDAQGRFGPYGGRYVPETLMDALRQLSVYYEAARQDPDFQAQFQHYLRTYVGRPSLLYFAERLTQEAGGAPSFLKAEAINKTAPTKLTNSIGQGFLARAMANPASIPRPGAGHHGVAPAP